MVLTEVATSTVSSGIINSNLIASVFGAFVGASLSGLFAFFVARFSAKQTLENERKLRNDELARKLKKETKIVFKEFEYNIRNLETIYSRIESEIDEIKVRDIDNYADSFNFDFWDSFKLDLWDVLEEHIIMALDNFYSNLRVEKCTAKTTKIRIMNSLKEAKVITEIINKYKAGNEDVEYDNKISFFPKGVKQWIRVGIGIFGIIFFLLKFSDWINFETMVSLMGLVSFLGYAIDGLFENVEERKSKLKES